MFKKHLFFICALFCALLVFGSTETSAIVKVKSKNTQAYKIGVKGYKMAKNDGLFAIVICRLD